MCIPGLTLNRIKQWLRNDGWMVGRWMHQLLASLPPLTHLLIWVFYPITHSDFCVNFPRTMSPTHADWCKLPNCESWWVLPWPISIRLPCLVEIIPLFIFTWFLRYPQIWMKLPHKAICFVVFIADCWSKGHSSWYLRLCTIGDSYFWIGLTLLIPNGEN